MSSPAERYAAARARAAAARTELARFQGAYDFPFDDFQIQACQALEAGGGVLVAAPTGAGKTLVGEFAVHLARARGLKAFYTTPIKALSNQKYADLVARYGADAVGLLTGDTSVNAHADIVVMTTEVLRNMLYSGSPRLARLGYVIMDEVHYLADRFRGPVWEEVIIHLDPSVTLVSLSATVSNAEELGRWLSEVRAEAGPTTVVVSEHRPVPLTQHMMVGKRLMDLYSLPVALEDASAEAKHLAAPPLNPDLVKAVSAAHRAALARHGSGEEWRVHRGKHGRSLRVRQREERRGSHGSGGKGNGAHRRRPAMRTAPREVVVETLREAHLLPAIVFVFSRSGCDAAVSRLLTMGVTLTTQDEADLIHQMIEERTAQIPPADLVAVGFHTWRAALERGFAAHHAGMLPVLKETVEEVFKAGLVKVVYATETLALGINMPARTVVLESLRKWNGSGHVTLTPGEYTQLTGRAGRRGIDSQGHAVVLATDEATPQVVSELASRRTYPLVSAFRPTYNMAVNLLTRATRARAREVLESSFAQFQADAGAVELAAQVRRARAKATSLEDRFTCHLGDFREYALLRQELTDAEADLSRVRRGLLGGGERRGSEHHTPERSEAQLRQEIGRLRAALRDHLCHGCTDREDHARAARSWVKAHAEQVRLEARIRRRTGTIARQFDSVCQVLTALGYLEPRELQAAAPDPHTPVPGHLEPARPQPPSPAAHSSELRVSEAGRLLARIYAERDLLIAQCVRAGVWDDLSPADLAGAVTACVFEPRSGGTQLGLPVAPGSALGRALRQMLGLARHIHTEETMARMGASGGVETAMSGAMAAWAGGANLADVLAKCEVPAGDFVRLARQVLDVLGQLALLDRPAVAMSAAEACLEVGRGVVTWSAVGEASHD